MGSIQHGHDQSGGHEPPVSPVRRLFELMRPEARDLRAVVGFGLAVGVLALATPLAVEALVGTVAMSLMVQQLVVLSLALLACLGFAAVLRALQSYYVEVIQRRLFVRVASELAYRLPRVRMEAYDRAYGPELVNRFFDVLTVQKVVAMLLLDGVALVLQTVIGLSLLAIYHPYLLGFDVVMVGGMVLATLVLGRGAVGTSIAESRAKYALAGRLEELSRVSRAYKPDGGPELALGRVDVLAHDYLDARRTHYRIVLRQVVFALGFQAVASAALLGLGGWLVIEGQLTLGQLVAAELIVAMIAASFAKLGKYLEGWYDLLAAVDKLGHLTGLPLERDDGEPLPRAWDADSAPTPASLRLLGVSYAYEGGRAVFDGVDLAASPGERVAVVGPSGSGKSTLADLVYGLRAATAGVVELDGVNVRDLSLESFRREVALVKGLDVIEATVMENVRMGRPSVTLAVAREALESVGLWAEASALPDGLHTVLASHGGPLSQGQARRLMLARALAGRPRLLVLDEALDGLDLDAHRRVVETLFRSSTPWTLLLVTHDESLARLCDQTVILAAGRADHTQESARGQDLGDLLREVSTCKHD